MRYLDSDILIWWWEEKHHWYWEQNSRDMTQALRIQLDPAWFSSLTLEEGNPPHYFLVKRKENPGPYGNHLNRIILDPAHRKIWWLPLDSAYHTHISWNIVPLTMEEARTMFPPGYTESRSIIQCGIPLEKVGFIQTGDMKTVQINLKKNGQLEWKYEEMVSSIKGLKSNPNKKSGTNAISLYVDGWLLWKHWPRGLLASEKETQMTWWGSGPDTPLEIVIGPILFILVPQLDMGN